MLTPLVWGDGLTGKVARSVFSGNIKVSGRMLFVRDIGDWAGGEDVPKDMVSGSFLVSISGLINIFENGDSRSVESEIPCFWCLADDLNPFNFGGEISMTSLSFEVPQLIVFLLL